MRRRSPRVLLLVVLLEAAIVAAIVLFLVERPDRASRPAPVAAGPHEPEPAEPVPASPQIPPPVAPSPPAVTTAPAAPPGPTEERPRPMSAVAGAEGDASDPLEGPATVDDVGFPPDASGWSPEEKLAYLRKVDADLEAREKRLALEVAAAQKRGDPLGAATRQVALGVVRAQRRQLEAQLDAGP